MIADLPPPLTAAEERELAARYLAGDAAAGQRVVASNLRYVKQVAARYAAKFGNDIDDLIQEGALALTLALPKFDPSRGIRLIGFCSHTINQRMCLAGMIANTTVGCRKSSAQQAKYGAAAERLARQLGRTPTFTETADEVRWSAEMRAGMGMVIRRDATIDGDSERARSIRNNLACSEAAPDEQVAAAHDSARMRAMFERLIAKLKPIEAEVLRARYFGDTATLGDVGQAVGLTRERVRQIERDALDKIRAWLKWAPDADPEWLTAGKPVKRRTQDPAAPRWGSRVTRMAK